MSKGTSRAGTAKKVSSKLMFAANIMRKLDNMECRGIDSIEPPEHIYQYLQEIASVVMDDGSFNGKGKNAEKLAICFYRAKSFAEAKKLFSAIVTDPDDVLFKNPKASDKRFVTVGIYNKPGKLGYWGVLYYALAAKETGDIELAKKLLLELLEKQQDRIDCLGTWCLADAMQQAACELDNLGVKEVFSGQPIGAVIEIIDKQTF